MIRPEELPEGVSRAVFDISVVKEAWVDFKTERDTKDKVQIDAAKEYLVAVLDYIENTHIWSWIDIKK